jgi:hypothetical protein
MSSCFTSDTTMTTTVNPPCSASDLVVRERPSHPLAASPRLRRARGGPSSFVHASSILQRIIDYENQYL